MLALLLTSAGLLYGAGTVPVGQPARVTPRAIEVGAFYNGAKVRVEGVAAPRSQMIVTVTGSDREEGFNRKGRFGPIWVTAGKVRISGAPSLFLRFSSSASCPVAGQGFDEGSLKARMRLAPRASDQASDARLRADYLALKKGDGVYAFRDGGIVTGKQTEQGTPYSLEFLWPKKAPPAEYQVHAYEVRDGAVIREETIPLAVVRTGFPAWLAGLAESRAPVYGVTAVVIGSMAGFGIDFLTLSIFGRKRPAAH